jgi:peptidoglycan/xylan/chitin deacetylase (PgdA/CDA1 family)
MQRCNSSWPDRCRRTNISLPAVVVALVLIWSALTGATSAASPPSAPCPRADSLGTSRILDVDAARTPQVGLKSFPETLPLADHEVILTFDDGPWPATTSRVLAALAQECVHATFFLIGRNASAHPELARRIASEGHTIGTHTWSHPSLKRIKPEAAIAEIDHGISAVETALRGTSIPSAPFFRFPGFESTPATLDLLQSRRIVVFGADLWASDWNRMTPKQELNLITERLAAAGNGIILFHDTKAQTAAMLPAFLRYLHDNGYHVVHVKPAEPAAAGGH